MIRRFFGVILVATVIVAAGISVADTWVRPDTTSGVALDAADSLFALPASTARIFDLNDLPYVETTITSDGTVDLGAARRVEFRAFGSGPAEGVYFKTVESGTAPYRTITAYVYIGAADSVRINAWK
jgi:hypothetical protein